MPRRVLVPVDGSKRSLQALEYSCVLFPDAQHSIVYVINPSRDWQEGPWLTDKWETQAEKTATTILEKAVSRIDRYGVDVETTVEWGEPYRRLLELIDQTEPDHVVLGSTGESSTGRFFLGGVSETVLERSSVPVTAVRFEEDLSAAPESPERVLVPVDGSASAEAGLAFALERFSDAEITALTVGELDIDVDHDELSGTYLESAVQQASEEADEILERARAQADDRDVEIRTETVFGKPSARIVEYAKAEGIEHVVVGHGSRSRTARLLLGSVAETVAKRAPCPVTVFR